MTYNFSQTIYSYMHGRSLMYFLVKDCHWAFIWWHIANDDIETARMKFTEKLHCPLFVLRVYDITDIFFDGTNAHGYIDVEVIGFTDHWYFNLPESGRNYIAEAGFREPDGRFIPIVRSNVVFIPPGCSQGSEEVWKYAEWMG